MSRLQKVTNFIISPDVPSAIQELDKMLANANLAYFLHKNDVDASRRINRNCLIIIIAQFLSCFRLSVTVLVGPDHPYFPLMGGMFKSMKKACRPFLLNIAVVVFESMCFRVIMYLNQTRGRRNILDPLKRFLHDNHGLDPKMFQELQLKLRVGQSYAYFCNIFTGICSSSCVVGLVLFDIRDMDDLTMQITLFLWLMMFIVGYVIAVRDYFYFCFPWYALILNAKMRLLMFVKEVEEYMDPGKKSNIIPEQKVILLIKRYQELKELIDPMNSLSSSVIATVTMTSFIASNFFFMTIYQDLGPILSLTFSFISFQSQLFGTFMLTRKANLDGCRLKLYNMFNSILVRESSSRSRNLSMKSFFKLRQIIKGNNNQRSSLSLVSSTGSSYGMQSPFFFQFSVANMFFLFATELVVNSRTSI